METPLNRRLASVVIGAVQFHKMTASKMLLLGICPGSGSVCPVVQAIKAVAPFFDLTVSNPRSPETSGDRFVFTNGGLLMRHYCLLLITSLIVFSIHTPGNAEEPTAPELTRIEADTESSQIKFYIDGKLMAVLKDDGLHVRAGINYGGMLTDYGKTHFDTSFAESSDNAEEK